MGITTAWIELEAVWGKNQERVGSAVHRVRERLPVPLVNLMKIAEARQAKR